MNKDFQFVSFITLFNSSSSSHSFPKFSTLYYYYYYYYYYYLCFSPFSFFVESLLLLEKISCSYSQLLYSGQYFILYEVAVCTTSGPFHRRAPSRRHVTPLKHTLCCRTGATRKKTHKNKNRKSVRVCACVCVCVKLNAQTRINRKKWTSDNIFFSIKRS